MSELFTATWHTAEVSETRKVDKSEIGVLWVHFGLQVKFLRSAAQGILSEAMSLYKQMQGSRHNSRQQAILAQRQQQSLRQ